MRKRTGRGARAAAGLRAAAVTTALLAGVVACGGGERPGSPEVVEESGPDEKTVALVERTNKAMAGTSFTAYGTNSAFGGAEQEITWDPDHGFHMTVRADDGGETDMFCRDGTSYISAPLLSETLNQRGQNVTVPQELTDRYVTVQAKSCDAYFAVPRTAQRAPERDTKIDGEKSTALTVRNAGGTDVYHIAGSGASHLLKWDAELEGMQTTMKYAGYGEEHPITLPPEDRRMKMTDFQAEVMGGGMGG
jgi:hypothetical protein